MGTLGRFFEAFTRGRLDVPQQLMTVADHRAPFAAYADRERYELIVPGEALAHLVDQEPAIVVDRWEDQHAFLARLLDELPDVLIYRPDELVISHAKVTIYD